MQVNLFAYGVLSFPEVVQAVTGRDPTFEPAVLPGYRRRGLLHPDGAVYAAVKPQAGAEVPGQLIRHLHLADLELFDRVEEVDSGYYARRHVRVRAAGQWHDAYAYVAGAEHAHRLSGDWTPAEFGPQRIRDFIAHILPTLLRPG